jgi:ribonuclease BN (tRNA processing enzyme)
MPSDQRETASALVRDGDAALLLDAGTGVRRLAIDPRPLEGVTRVHICLTHFHLDHVIGLFYAADLGVPVEIWGGGEVLEATPTADLVARLLASPFAPPSFIRSLPDVHELREGDQLVGPFHVRARKQPLHTNPTLALRVGDELACCTDTAYDEANAEFARGARVLLHEAFVAADSTSDRGHTAAGEAARIAAAAGVERLVLIHLNPLDADDDALLAFARSNFAATEVGRDGLEL